MSKQIIWSPAADIDFADILACLSKKWSNKVVNQFIDTVDVYLQFISVNPKMFPLINKKLNVRKCVLTKQNSLFYRELKDSVELIRIFDTRQNPKKLRLD